MEIPQQGIHEFDYELPENKIAQYPLNHRDHSRLLLYNRFGIRDLYFYELPELISENNLLIFNETRVVQARIQFVKDTGASIELFCLQPLGELTVGFHAKKKVRWKCLVGNSKKWKNGLLTKRIDDWELKAKRISQEEKYSVIEFTWDHQFYSFAEVLDHIGQTPIPPYLNRKAESADKETYQTVYAHNAGSVAAPTAGLHFTDELLHKIQQMGAQSAFINLHIGAGTFLPLSEGGIDKHRMHREFMAFSFEEILKISQSKPEKNVAIGTTALRSLESLYLWGCRLNEDSDAPFNIQQWDAFHLKLLDAGQSLENVLQFMAKNQMEQLRGHTELMIAPGYQPKMVKKLLTNFHQPKSTLLVLVAALIGDDWKKVYEHALGHNYRFLSYGDACLLDFGG